jgi:hypothetical protein
MHEVTTELITQESLPFAPMAFQLNLKNIAPWLISKFTAYKACVAVLARSHGKELLSGCDAVCL